MDLHYAKQTLSKLADDFRHRTSMKIVGLVIALYLSSIVLAYFWFPDPTAEYTFWTLPVKIVVMGYWGFVAFAISIELFGRLAKKENYQNEMLVGAAVALMASGVVSMETLKSMAMVEAARSEAYIRGYVLMNGALEQATKSPETIEQIRLNYSKTLIREMYIKGGLPEDYLDREEAMKLDK